MLSIASLQGLERIAAGALLDDLEGAVDDAAGRALLALPEHLVDDLADEDAPVDRIGLDLCELLRVLCAWVTILLGAVAGAGLLATVYAGSIERASNDLVPNTREVLHTTATDEHDRVLLEVVTLTRDVGRDLHLGGETHAGDLAQRGVRLLGRDRVQRAYTPLAVAASRRDPASSSSSASACGPVEPVAAQSARAFSSLFGAPRPRYWSGYLQTKIGATAKRRPPTPYGIAPLTTASATPQGKWESNGKTGAGL